MAELLIRAVNGTGVYSDAGGPARGHIVARHEDGHTWGRAECPPEYYILKLPGVPESAVDEHTRPFGYKIKFTVTASVPSTDTHTIKAEATLFNAANGRGKLTRAIVENFLTAWGATNISEADNAVTFKVKILDAIKSARFWGLNRVDDLFLTEKSYASATGIHRIEINYSLKTFADAQERDNYVNSLRLNTTLVSHDAAQKIVTVDIARVKVRDNFLRDVEEKVTRLPLRSRRYSLTAALMSQIEAAGGVMTINTTAYNAALIDEAVG